MSSNQQRQVARRAFAAEYNDATHVFKESDDEMAPKYALLPSGVRANRVFAVATCTEVDDVGNDQEYWRGRMVDPTGTFFAYAGQYQPEAASFLRDVEPPVYVAVVGKPRTYETDEGDMRVSLRPEYISKVDETTRDNWLVETAERTLDRIEEYQATDVGGDMAPPDLKLAADVYDIDPSTYLSDVEDALETVEPTADDTN